MAICLVHLRPPLAETFATCLKCCHCHLSWNVGPVLAIYWGQPPLPVLHSTLWQPLFLVIRYKTRNFSPVWVKILWLLFSSPVVTLPDSSSRPNKGSFWKFQNIYARIVFYWCLYLQWPKKVKNITKLYISWVLRHFLVPDMTEQFYFSRF